MNITLRPGYVYIIASKSRPKDLKIGKALLVERRAFELSLADPDIVVVAAMFFLDVFATETRMHLFFEAAQVGRERFGVSHKQAIAELQRLFEREVHERQQLESVIRFMADCGEFTLDNSGESMACDGSALSTVLAHVPSPADGRNVKTLVAVALTAGPAAVEACRLLARSGLLAYSSESVVLFDKADDSKMERVFKGRAVAKTWRAQLAKYAGLRHNGAAVALNAWLDQTEAGSELVDRVSPVAYV